MHRRNCPACGVVGGAALETIDLEEQHVLYAPRNMPRQQALTAAAKESAPGYAMWRCGGCELEWSDPMRAPGGKWYGLAYEALDLYPRTRWEFERVISASPRAATVFDIGCGNGAFLKRCASVGIASRGVDFSAEAVHQCVRDGLDVSRVDVGLDLSSFAGVNATVITAFQVLEHLSDPASLFECARAVSAEQAVLWVAVPSNRRPERIFNERDYLDQPPHHLTRWSRKSLAALGEKCGWTLEEVLFEPITLSAALWWISTGNGTYKRLLGRRARAASSAERMVRWIHYPAAFALRQTRYRSMSGFSMLGRFRRRRIGRATAES